MKYEKYDFQECNLKDASPLITTWAEKNQIGMFDFDECMFDRSHEDTIKEHLVWAKNNYNTLAIIESHPFFVNDDWYQKKITYIKEVASDIKLPLIFLTADYKLWNNIRNNSAFFPGWYIRQRRWAKQMNYRDFIFSDDRKYNFSCGNKSNLRSEKIYNYIECYKRKRKDWYITIYNHPTARISDVEGKNIAGLTKEQVVIWDNEIRDKIPEFQNDLIPPDNFFTNPHTTLFPVYTDSYCNLVMEHSMEVAILSEKSFKPFIAQQIPIFLAHTGAAAAMANLGFDIFYDFIDHNKYDFVESITGYRITENFTLRIDKVHELIDELYKTNFIDFIHNTNTKDRLKQNQDYFYSDEIDKRSIVQFEQLLNK